LRCHVLDAEDLEAGGLERADRRLAARTRALDEDLDLLQPVLHALSRARIGGDLGGKRRRLAGALEAGRAGRIPDDDVAYHDGQPAPMPDPPVGTDFLETLDRLLALAAQVTLDLEIRVDVVAELRDLAVGQVAYLCVERQPELGGDSARGRTPDPEDVRERDLEPLLSGKIYACNSGHLALPLLVSGVRADDHGPAVPPDHAAALAHWFD